MPKRNLNNIIIMKSNPTIHLFENIIKDIFYINAYNPIDMFDFSLLSHAELERIKNICAIEVSFPGYGINNTIQHYNEVIKPYCNFICSAFSINKTYVFATESFITTRSRIRSYKGLFYKKKVLNCIQKEYTLQDPYTLIAAVFPWSGNEEICISKMFDPCTSFALSLETDRELEMLMDYIVMKNLIFDFSTNTFTINYAQIISNFCNSHRFLYRFTGEGEDCFNLQFFCMKQDMNELMQLIKSNLLN